MKNKWRDNIANLFLFTIVFSEFRFAMTYKMYPSILFIVRDRRMDLLTEYLLFPIIIYAIFILIKGSE